MREPDRHEAEIEETEQVSDDRAIAARIRAGDVAAYEALYRTYWQKLYAYAFRFLRSKEESEEAVQDVLFRVWRGRTEWNPGSIANFLYLSVRNTSVDRLRRAVVAKRWAEHEVAESASAPPVTPVAELRLEDAEVAAAIERAIAELPPKRRATCTLRLIDGLSYAQIAQRLGVSEKTVENQLARGLQFLRERMGHLR